ncbi:MAG: hypothetical protein GX978_06050 [Tissierellia bacterium]|nr:hypothetical protein [Tissierellia bacterium]
MKGKSIVAIVISIIMIVVGGYLLFNLAFLLFALIVNTTMQMSGQSDTDPPGILARLLGYTGIGLLTYLGLKYFSNHSQLKHTLRATFLTLPLMALLVSIGIAFHQQADAIILGIGAVVMIPVLIYLYAKKLPWMYWLATFYVAALGVIVIIKNIQI